MTRVLKSFFRRDEGANLVEYGILIVLVALVAVGGLNALGTNLNTFFQQIADNIGGAQVPALP